MFGREAGREISLHLRQGPVPVPGGTWVTISYRGGNLTGIAPAEVPAPVAARKAARADHDARTYRGVITECHIDGLKGGRFTIEADDRPVVTMNVPPEMALHFSSASVPPATAARVAPVCRSP